MVRRFTGRAVARGRTTDASVILRPYGPRRYTGVDGEIGGLTNAEALRMLLPNQGPQWELGGTVVYQHYQWPHCEGHPPLEGANGHVSSKGATQRHSSGHGKPIRKSGA